MAYSHSLRWQNSQEGMRLTNIYTFQVIYTSTKMRLQNVINEMWFEKFAEKSLLLFCRNHTMMAGKLKRFRNQIIFLALKKQEVLWNTMRHAFRTIQKHFINPIQEYHISDNATLHKNCFKVVLYIFLKSYNKFVQKLCHNERNGSLKVGIKINLWRVGILLNGAVDI